MNYIRKFVRNPVLTALLCIVLIIAGYFGTRGIVLLKAISSVSNRIAQYGYSAKWDGIRFKGIRKVFISKIHINSIDGGNSVSLDSTSIKVRLFPLIFKNVVIREFNSKSVMAIYSPGDTTANAPPLNNSGLISNDSSGFPGHLMSRDLALFAYHFVRRFVSHVPSGIDIGVISCDYAYSGEISNISIAELTLKKEKFFAKVRFGKDDRYAFMPVSGKFNRSPSIIEFNITNPDTGTLHIPFLMDRFGFAAGFDSLNFFVNLGKRSKQLVDISGNISLAGLNIKGERLSTSNIHISQFQCDYLLHIRNDNVELDSSSVVALNRISLNPFVRLSFKQEPQIDFKITPQRWQADDLFGSLPPGMFTSIIGTQAEGFLDFSLDFSINPKMPDSLKFSLGFKGKDFSVVSFGTDDYRILNSTFIHRAYQGGKLISSFEVGPGNPDFVPLENISPSVRAAVMTSEDGSFYYHNGFNPEAFRESIATNIKEGRFARGGSTISMQLIKNVFLIRNKTVARKIEEALIVWLIETLDLVPKQRMYEVYLNIIEWGPGIYGIGQASRYYFDKHPSELSLPESVFLASIVPRPRWFKYSFETNGKPKPFFSVYFNHLKELMVRKELIPESDTAGVAPVVKLTGPAAEMIDTSGVRSMPEEFTPLEPIWIKKFTIQE